MTFQELGKLLTAPKAAKKIGIGVKKFRKHYTRFGGFVLDGRTYVYEEVLRNALQDNSRWSMDGSGDDQREETSPPVPNEKGSVPMGAGGKRQVSSTTDLPDPHRIFG